MTRREFAERLAILADDYSYWGMSVGQVIATIHEVEDALASGATESYVEWLEDEIEECDGDDGDEDRQDHAAAAAELLAALKGGEVHE